MTKERFCIADSAALAAAQKIKVIYDVDADDSYHVTRWFHNSVDYIAVLTRAGCGKLLLREGEITVSEGDLLVISADLLRSYCSDRCSWSFLWFEFDCEYIPFSPLLKYKLEPDAWRTELCGECLQMMLDKRGESASALFTAIVYMWSDSAGIIQRSENNALIFSSVEFIKNNIRTVTVEQIAERLYVSDRTLRNLFNKYLGCSPSELLRKIKVKEAQDLLESTIFTVSEIAERLGYGNPFYFSKLFTRHTGISPTEYRRRSNQYRLQLNAPQDTFIESDT